MNLSLDATTALDPVFMLAAIGGSFLLTMVIALTYVQTHRGLSYSQSFLFSLVLLGMLGSVIMMIATVSLLAAIGILGAFSIVRFRTAIKDPKDMAYILAVLAIGMAMGAHMYLLAVMTTAILAAVIWGLTAVNFGSTRKHDSLLRLTCKAEKGGVMQTASYEALLAKLTQHFTLLSAHVRGDGTHMELTYGVRGKRGESLTGLLQVLAKEQGVEHADLFDAKHEVEF